MCGLERQDIWGLLELLTGIYSENSVWGGEAGQVHRLYEFFFFGGGGGGWGRRGGGAGKFGRKLLPLDRTLKI